MYNVLCTAINMKRVHLFISGHVQGVGFRYATQDKALELGLYGWVRNIYDGRVEAVAEGEDNLIKEFIEYCHIGPMGATVKEVKIEEEIPNSEFKNFEIT